MKPVSLVLLAVCSLPLAADEGIWPFAQFPKDTVKEKREFVMPDDLLEKMRQGTVKLADGSGALVSAGGLVLTNQHLLTPCLTALSKPGKDLVEDGFQAATQADEIRCPGMDAMVMVSAEDVSAQVKAAVKEDTPPVQALEQRIAAMLAIEKDCAAKTGDRCLVVKLYSGVRYDLYRYKVYSDVRVVFAPERDIAFFGRERDSITYLRYGLDAAFVRLYQDGKPASTPVFFKWSADGAKEGDFVLTPGNPLTTSRLVTSSQLSFQRDTVIPLTIQRLQPRIQVLREFAAKGDENLKAALPLMSRLLTEYKQTAGKYVGLRDDRIVTRKAIFDGKIRRAVERDPALGTEAGKVWDEVSKAYKLWGPNEKLYQYLEGSAAYGSTLFQMARTTLRLAEERGKPNEQRLAEFRNSVLAETERQLYAATPVNEAMEVLLLAGYFEELKRLSDKEAPLKAILGGRTPAAAAEAYVKACKLKDPAERKRLAASPDAARKSDDGMIKLALLLDDPARKIRKKREEAIESLETSAAERIAKYRLTLFGAAEYPDATGTTRVTYGIVKGYKDRAAVDAPWASTFGGLYYRKNNDGPYQVPKRWVEAQKTLTLITPLDFVSTADIGGGNAGAPVLSRTGELVGITFDGNLESLATTFMYSEEKARAVHVATQGIAESLKKVYGATALLKELSIPQ